MPHTTYQRVFESSSPLGIWLEIVNYRLLFEEASFKGGEWLEDEDGDYRYFAAYTERQ